MGNNQERMLGESYSGRICQILFQCGGMSSLTKQCNEWNTSSLWNVSFTGLSAFGLKYPEK